MPKLLRAKRSASDQLDGFRGYKLYFPSPFGLGPGLRRWSRRLLGFWAILGMGVPGTETNGTNLALSCICFYGRFP